MKSRVERALLLLVLVPSPLLHAQQRTLTLDDIYGPAARVNFSGAPAPAFVWIDDDHYAWPRTADGDRGSVEWLKVDAATGSSAPLFDAAKAEAAMAAIPGVTAAEARPLLRSRDLVFNGAYTKALVTIGGDLYLCDFAGNRAARLTSADGDEDEATFSPDDAKVAFVRRNNLFVVDTATLREAALTTDGAPRILNGTLDWVYEEEIYGRGEKRAYWWSPDSSRLAFLRIDDTAVSTYITLDDISYDPRVETWDYPRAGDPNPTVKLGVVRAAGGPADVGWIDTSRYAGTDILIVRVAWTPLGRLTYQVQNRTQSWLDLNVIDVAATGSAPATLLRETSPYWINAEEAAPPTWLADGSFVWLSARSGFRHAYRYAADGTLLGQLTTGRWELRALHGVDEKGGWLYFSGTERSPIGRDVYRVKLDGTGFSRLSQAAGTHNARFSPGFGFFIDRASDVSTPGQVRLHRGDGRNVRTLHENRVTALSDYKLSKPEFVQVTTRDGFVMEAMMIKPPDFDPSKRYPVYQFTYGGPHSQEVNNAWSLQNMYHQLLAQHGIIVWILDNRTASGKGLESTWPVFRRFGEVELRDIEDGVAWLKRQPVRRWLPHRTPRVELRGVPDRVRAHAQHELRHGDCRRHRVRLAQLRFGVHRTLHGAAEGQPRRLPQQLAPVRRRDAPRRAAPDARRHRRQRARAEHHAAGLRAAAGRQAVQPDALPQVAPRGDRPLARQAHVRHDARLHG